MVSWNNLDTLKAFQELQKTKDDVVLKEVLAGRASDEIIVLVGPEGDFSVDLTGKKAGRGAYICNNKECFDKAVKEHRFDRSFKCTVDKNIFDELSEQLFK